MVATDTGTYSFNVINFPRISLGSANVFGENSAALFAQYTPTPTGSVTDGYVGSAAVGLAR
ncbi:hypothetical protein NF700_03490 [Sphingomonadaceae bacterium OTU29MARTA1]|nr:hypothetical protein NF700_03490 [Sphingomonadaceae bacterium OTU29MARTA1]